MRRLRAATLKVTLGVTLGLATLGIMTPNSALAATLMGTGVTVSCGGWVEIRKGAPNKQVLEEWALGYLSGVAIWSPESPLDNLDPGAVFVWLDNACQSKPLEPFKSALDAFVRARSTPPAATGPARPGGTTPPAAGAARPR